MPELKEIPLKDLVIGKGQVRIRDAGKDIDELANSIAKLGLLEPIVVCPAEEQGKFEILTGQRRFLAHELLKRPTILATVREKVDDTSAKVISISENLVRRDPHSADLIDACTALYRKYGSMKQVAAETGLSEAKVSAYVKYDRLAPELRKLVDEQGVDVKVALRAQDAASVSGEFNADEAVKFAKEMSGMSGAQVDKIVKTRKTNPERSVDEIIEAAKSGEKITSIQVHLGAQEHASLVSYASEEGTTLPDAASTLIFEGLTNKGFLKEI